MDLEQMGQVARAAARTLAVAGTQVKNDALHYIADEIESAGPRILPANAEDVEAAAAAGIGSAMLDRLLLNESRLAALARDTRHVASLPDPVGAEYEGRVLANGLRLVKRKVPIGVIGVIYEARPNVTVDVAALCLKAGNASILRGGKETRRSNLALTAAIGAGLEKAGLTDGAVQSITDPDREIVSQLLRLDRYVDMIIPRGGAALHRLCREESTIPVITGGMGICHIYVDESADLGRAVEIVENAKVQRPSVCNALDTVLVHESIAPAFLPELAARMADCGVELRADQTAREILEASAAGNRVRVVPAGPDDFDTEWMSLVLGIRVVPGMDDAIAHIHEHSTEHSDSILTQDLDHARRFVDEVNSAAVYVNASTRFTDGGQFGLGAEVAVSTQKLHARGPMGLEELTTYKWIGWGSGQIRE